MEKLFKIDWLNDHIIVHFKGIRTTDMETLTKDSVEAIADGIYRVDFVNPYKMVIHFGELYNSSELINSIDDMLHNLGLRRES